MQLKLCLKVISIAMEIHRRALIKPTSFFDRAEPFTRWTKKIPLSLEL
jgi:hypothetical protein